jgi:CheY-like chemotaxis protein
VLDALRSDETTRDVPVIIASIVDEKPRGLALGAASYLTKPVSRDDLIEALRDVKVLSA